MRLSRTTGVGAGLLIVLLGLWAGLVAFVGPYFNYGFQPDTAWHFTLNRLWLEILPAVAVVLGGITMIAARRRSSGVMGCWLALAGGFWLILGPSVSMFWQHPATGTLISGIGTPIGGYDRAAVAMLGFFYGAGALIVALSAFSAARFVHRAPRVAERPLADAEGPISARRVGWPAPAQSEPARNEPARSASSRAGASPGS